MKLGATRIFTKITAVSLIGLLITQPVVYAQNNKDVTADCLSPASNVDTFSFFGLFQKAYSKGSSFSWGIQQLDLNIFFSFVPKGMKASVSHAVNKFLTLAFPEKNIKKIAVLFEASSDEYLNELFRQEMALKAKSRKGAFNYGLGKLLAGERGLRTKNDYINAILRMADYRRSDLSKLRKNQVQAIYYNMRKKVRFEQEVSEKTKWVKLNAQIRFDDEDTVINKKILVEKNEIGFNAVLLNDNFQTQEAILRELMENVAGIPDNKLRKEIHILESLKREIKKTNEVKRLLNAAVEDISKHTRTLAEADLLAGIKKIETVQVRLKRSKAAKRSVYNKLTDILNEGRYFEQGRYKQGMEILTQAILLLDVYRKNLLIRYNGRSEHTLEISGRPIDIAALVEKKAGLAKQYIDADDPQNALNSLQFLSVFFSQQQKNGLNINQAIGLGKNTAELIAGVSKAITEKENALLIANALKKIDDVDSYIRESSQLLAKNKDYFSRMGELTHYFNLNRAVYKLDNVQKGKIYRQELLSAIEIINQVIFDVTQSSELALARGMICQELSVVISRLNTAISMVKERNTAIRLVLNPEEMQSIGHTKDLLQQKAAFSRIGYRVYLQSVREDLEFFRLSLRAIEIIADEKNLGTEKKTEEIGPVILETQLELFNQDLIIAGAV
ncbi:MAG: hypothetical protein HY810_06785 [Candidatus Omnitrophica bacterium]|nr:hypothetical protein [Candidatus Omnitrophota bacterium]